MTSYIKGNLLLLKFYFSHLGTVRSLPQWMRNPDHLKEVFESKKEKGEMDSFQLKLSDETAKTYNSEMENLKANLRRLHFGEKEMFSYKVQLLLLFLLRILSVGSAFYGNVRLTAILSLLQFVVAPYSLFVSLSLAIALAPPIYASHYLAFNIFRCTGSLLEQVFGHMSLFQTLGSLEVPISGSFVIVFLVVDQTACCYFHYFTPTKKFTFRETVIHFVWGFLNTKTYHMVLLLHMMNAGVTVPVWIWLADAAFSLTPIIAERISKFWMHWLELFYHQHRMAHLPKVYEHAHKLHHYLHGTNAFDAHIYGNGMPEEFFFGLFEIGMGLVYSQYPASLNRYILQLSIDNKNGHTQKPEDTCGENFHADHHLLHVKNYGIYNSLMDMYFSTANHSQKYMIKPALYIKGDRNIVYDIEKTEENNQVVFTFTPRL